MLLDYRPPHIVDRRWKILKGLFKQEMTATVCGCFFRVSFWGWFYRETKRKPPIFG